MSFLHSIEVIFWSNSIIVPYNKSSRYFVDSFNQIILVSFRMVRSITFQKSIIFRWMAVARMLLWVQALWWHFEIRVCINWCIICLQKDDLWHVTKIIWKYKPNNSIFQGFLNIHIATLSFKLCKKLNHYRFIKRLGILMICGTG